MTKCCVGKHAATDITNSRWLFEHRAFQRRQVILVLFQLHGQWHVLFPAGDHSSAWPNDTTVTLTNLHIVGLRLLLKWCSCSGHVHQFNKQTFSGAQWQTLFDKSSNKITMRFALVLMYTSGCSSTSMTKQTLPLWTSQKIWLPAQIQETTGHSISVDTQSKLPSEPSTGSRMVVRTEISWISTDQSHNQECTIWPHCQVVAKYSFCHLAKTAFQRMRHKPCLPSGNPPSKVTNSTMVWKDL